MSTLQTFTIQNAGQLSVHIKSLRKARGMTQAALGQRIGVKQARIADIERDPGSVSLDQLIQIVHALDARLLLADTQRYGATNPQTHVVSEKTADW